MRYRVSRSSKSDTVRIQCVPGSEPINATYTTDYDIKYGDFFNRFRKDIDRKDTTYKFQFKDNILNVITYHLDEYGNYVKSDDLYEFDADSSLDSLKSDIVNLTEYYKKLEDETRANINRKIQALQHEDMMTKVIKKVLHFKSTKKVDFDSMEDMGEYLEYLKNNRNAIINKLTNYKWENPAISFFRATAAIILGFSFFLFYPCMYLYLGFLYDPIKLLVRTMFFGGLASIISLVCGAVVEFMDQGKVIDMLIDVISNNYRYEKNKEEVQPENEFVHDKFLTFIKKDFEYIKSHPEGSYDDCISKLQTLIGEYTRDASTELAGQGTLDRFAYLSRLTDIEKEIYSRNKNVGLLRRDSLQFKDDILESRLTYLGLNGAEEFPSGWLSLIYDSIQKILADPYEGCEVDILKNLEIAQNYVNSSLASTQEGTLLFLSSQESELVRRSAALDIEVAKRRSRAVKASSLRRDMQILENLVGVDLQGIDGKMKLEEGDSFEGQKITM